MDKVSPEDSSPNNLRRIKERGLLELESSIFNVFDVALRTRAEASEDVAARELDKLCPSTQSSKVEGYLWTLWHLFLDIVPHDSGRPGQERLVTILSRLRDVSAQAWPLGMPTVSGSYAPLWRSSRGESIPSCDRPQ